MTNSRIVHDPRDPSVCICVLNWKEHEKTLRCLQSLVAQDYANVRIVVVDNGSPADSIAALKSCGLSFDLILNRKNLGYTGGCNIGMCHALEHGADYVWLVNSDTVVQADALTKLIDAAVANPSAGVLSPVIYSDLERRTIQNCGMQVDPNCGVVEYCDDIQAAVDCMKGSPRQYCVWGTAMLIRRSVMERVGLLDDRFFAYCEDVDYCMRAIGAGFKVRLVPDAGILHASFAQHLDRPPHFTFYMARNWVLFWAKYATRFRRAKYTYWKIRLTLSAFQQGRQDRTTTYLFLDGIWCGLLGRTGGWTIDDRRLKAPLLLKKFSVASSRLLVNRPEYLEQAPAVRPPRRSLSGLFSWR